MIIIICGTSSTFITPPHQTSQQGCSGRRYTTGLLACRPNGGQQILQSFVCVGEAGGGVPNFIVELE